MKRQSLYASEKDEINAKKKLTSKQKNSILNLSIYKLNLSIYILRLSLYILSLRIENFIRNDGFLFASFITKKRPVKMYSTLTGRYSYIMVLLFFTEAFSLFFN